MPAAAVRQDTDAVGFRTARPTPAIPPQRRFRVVAEPPQGQRKGRQGALAPIFGLSSVLVVVLLFLVGCQAVAIRGGYVKQDLRSQIEMARVELEELTAERQRMEAAGTIMPRATARLKMQWPQATEFIRTPLAASGEGKVAAAPNL